MKPRTPATPLTLSTAPEVLLLREYCVLMRESERRVRAQLTAGACRVAPRMVRPYRWLLADLADYFALQLEEALIDFEFARLLGTPAKEMDFWLAIIEHELGEEIGAPGHRVPNVRAARHFALKVLTSKAVAR